MKTPFLAVYDYGQGGIWIVLLAESADQIKERYPELKVIERPAPSMNDEELEVIRARRTLDIDDETDAFLASLRESRDK